MKKTVAAALRFSEYLHDQFDWTFALGSILTLKSPLFSSESEWRVICGQSEHLKLQEGESNPKKKKRSNTRHVHYVDLPLSDWELVEIVCGPRSLLGPTSRNIRNWILNSSFQQVDAPIVKSACRLWR